MSGQSNKNWLRAFVAIASYAYEDVVFLIQSRVQIKLVLCTGGFNEDKTSLISQLWSAIRVNARKEELTL